MKQLIILSISLILGLTSTKTNPESNTLTITVNGVRNTDGVIGVALYDDSSEFPDGEFYEATSESISSDGSVEITIEDVPSGTYAIAVMHDENENGDLDFNAQGMPLEGYGFSNDAMGNMGPPDFDDASFEVDADTDIEIDLIYLL